MRILKHGSLQLFGPCSETYTNIYIFNCGRHENVLLGFLTLGNITDSPNCYVPNPSWSLSCDHHSHLAASDWAGRDMKANPLLWVTGPLWLWLKDFPWPYQNFLRHGLHLRHSVLNIFPSIFSEPESYLNQIIPEPKFSQISPASSPFFLTDIFPSK